MNLIVFNTIYILSCTRDLEQTNSFNLDQVYSNTRVNTSLTQVNTNQHESDTSQHEYNASQHESDTSQKVS